VRNRVVVTVYQEIVSDQDKARNSDRRYTNAGQKVKELGNEPKLYHCIVMFNSVIARPKSFKSVCVLVYMSNIL
jgi:hypothetical protein